MLSNLTPQEDGSFLVQLGTIGRPNINGFIYAPIDLKQLAKFNEHPRAGGLGQRILDAKKEYYGVPPEDVGFTLEYVMGSTENDPSAPLGKVQHLRALLRLSGPKSEEVRKLIEDGEKPAYFGLRAISAQGGWVNNRPVYDVQEILSWDLLSENPYPEAK